jgi:hypothetical protein
MLHDALVNGMEEPSAAETFAKLDEEPFYLSSNAYREFPLKQIADKKRVIEHQE